MKNICLALTALLAPCALNSTIDSKNYNALSILRSTCKISYNNSRVVLPKPNSTISGQNLTVVGLLRNGKNRPVKNTNVIVSIDGKAVAVVTSDKNGVWTYKVRPGVSLSNGQHTISAVESSCHICLQPTTFTVDSTRSKKVSTRTCTVNADNSLIAYPYNDAFINSTTPPVVGLLYDADFNPVANEQVVIKRGSTVLSTVTSDSNGVFAYTLTSEQALSPDGQYTLSAQACTTPTVNISPVTFTIDTVAPAAPVITSHSVSNHQVTLNGTTEAFATITLYIDSSSQGEITYADSNGNWTIDLFLNSGSHSVQAEATDIAFNTGPLSAAYTFTV